MSTDNEHLAVLIHDFCETYGYGFRDNYSGRYMYGKTCVGIVTGDGIFRLAMELGTFLNANSDDPQTDMCILDRWQSQDAMGLGMIVYFPGIQMPEQPE